jgi:hypothetical protein
MADASPEVEAIPCADLDTIIAVMVISVKENYLPGPRRFSEGPEGGNDERGRG